MCVLTGSNIAKLAFSTVKCVGVCVEASFPCVCSGEERKTSESCERRGRRRSAALREAAPTASPPFFYRLVEIVRIRPGGFSIIFFLWPITVI